MDLGLKGRAALVTGGSAGIGKAAAKALAAEGVDVAIVARDPARLQLAAEEISSATAVRVLPIPADLSKRDQATNLVERVVAGLGRLDILVNCAGASAFGDPLEIDPNAFAEAMDLKYLGYVRCARAAAPFMMNQGWGRIINVLGSGGKQVRLFRKGETDVIPPHLPGGAANAALMLFTKGFGLRLASYGVLVNAVSPSVVATERLIRLISSSAETGGVTYAEAESSMFADVPVGRPARPEEVADVILFLSSERATYFVGSNLMMDGGSVTAI